MAGVTSQAGRFAPAEAPEVQMGSGAAAPPAGNRFAAPRRTGVRSRYVDTMNAGGSGAAGGGASVGLASLVPKPAFGPPAGEQPVSICKLANSQPVGILSAWQVRTVKHPQPMCAAAAVGNGSAMCLPYRQGFAK